MLVKKYVDGECVGFEEVPDPAPQEVSVASKSVLKRVAAQAVEAVKPKAKEKGK